MLQEKSLIIRSNGVHSPYIQFSYYSDILFSTTVDAVANMNYFTQQNIDILQYKKHYSKTKNFTFTFYEESDVPFTFQSGQYIYLDIVLFEFHDAGAVLAKSLKIQ